MSVAGNLVMLFGLLLPWLAVLAVAGAITYGIVRLAKARQPKPIGPQTAAATEAPAEDEVTPS
jgi:hypothetical protein